MTDYLKTFISRNKDMLNENNFEKLYNACFLSERPDLTQLLMKANINPLLYLKEVPSDYLAYSDVKTIKIPSNIETIGNSAFLNSELEDIVIENGVKNLGFLSFAGCEDLKEIWLPDSIEDIDEQCFHNCRNLSKISLGSNLKGMDARAFANTAIEKLFLPVSVRFLGRQCFRGMDNLKEIVYEGSRDEWVNYVTKGEDIQELGIDSRVKITYMR